MTDCEYKHTPADLHRVCNIALSMGAQEFVVLQSGETIPRTLSIEQGADEVVHTHRHLDGQELYYLANKENHAVDVAFRLQDQPSKVIVWHHVTGRRTTLKKRADGSYRLRLKPVESVCMTYRIIH